MAGTILATALVLVAGAGAVGMGAIAGAAVVAALLAFPAYWSGALVRMQGAVSSPGSGVAQAPAKAPAGAAKER